MNQLDENKVVANVITDLTKDLIQTLYRSIPDRVSKKYQQYFEKFDFALSRDSKTCLNVRTIINKESSVKLDDIYVKSSYISDGEFYNDDDLCQAVRDEKRLVVLGFGGIGKTIFCKYLWLSVFRNPAGKIPIFFELRHLNDLTTQDLISYIRASLSDTGDLIPSDVFQNMMKDGRFIFILDGFDEIPDNNRNEIEKQILRLAASFPNCGLVISSRQDDRFFAWGEFQIYRVQNFNKEQSREVITKAKFDEEIKSEFITEIIDKRYDKYSEFFATPLLTLMMLMTYSQIKYIPDNPTIFYKYAFQTLYTLHDASKQAYQRKRYVDLGEGEFIHAFSLFCLSTYADSEHSFEKTEFVSRMNAVKDRVKFDFDSEQFLKEATESVNLLFKEGNSYNFTHRSFQEYFCAYAATHYYPESFRELVAKIPVSYSDSVFEMMLGINSDVFEKMYILPEFLDHENDIIKFSKLKTNLELLNFAGSQYQIIYSPGKKMWAFHHSEFQHNLKYKELVERVQSAYRSVYIQEISNERNRISIDESVNNADNFVKLLADITKIKMRKNFAYQFNIDFQNKKISSNELGNINTNNILFDKNDNNCLDFDIDDYFEILNSDPYLSRVTTSLKNSVVFVKKRCDELKKHDKKVKSLGQDILSM